MRYFYPQLSELQTERHFHSLLIGYFSTACECELQSRKIPLIKEHIAVIKNGGGMWVGNGMENLFLEWGLVKRSDN